MKNPTLKKLFKTQVDKGFASLEKNKILKAQEEQEAKNKKLKIKAEAEQFVRNILNQNTVSSAIVHNASYVPVYAFNARHHNSISQRELYDAIIEVLEENEIPFEDIQDGEDEDVYSIRIVIGGNLES